MTAQLEKFHLNPSAESEFCFDSDQQKATDRQVLTSKATTTDLKDVVRQTLLPRRLEIINQNATWIEHHENRVLKYVIDGDSLDPTRIEPYLQECRTDSEHALWRYLRYQNASPYSEYVGRRQRFLIRDAGHPHQPIMAIAAIGSSIMQLRDRDRWIGWQIDTDLTAEEKEQRRCGELSYKEALARMQARRERNRELREIKKQRIANIADLYVSQAIPPYNELTAGKLLCLMMLSNEVRDLFRTKYTGRQTMLAGRETVDLVLIVTTSIFGSQSSIYNRLRFLDQLAYIPIGRTVGFGTVQVSTAEFQEMRRYLAEHDKEPSNRFGKGCNWRMRVIRAYHDLRCKLEPDYQQDGNSALLHGHGRGVYAAPLACNARAYLTGEDNDILYYDWPIEELIGWWKERWLRMRASNPEVMARVRAFRKEAFRVSGFILTGASTPAD